MKKLIMSVIMCATLVFMSACGSSGGGSSDAVNAGAGTTGTTTVPTVTAINNANAIVSWFNSLMSEFEKDTEEIKDFKKEAIENGFKVSHGYVKYDYKEIYKITKPTSNIVILETYSFKETNGILEKINYEKDELRMENDGSISVVWNCEEYKNSTIAKTNEVSLFNSLEDLKKLYSNEIKLTSVDFNILMNKFPNNGFSGGVISSTSEKFSYTRNKDNLNIFVESDGYIYVKVNNNSSVKMFERSLGVFEQLTVDKVLNIFYDVLNKENITEDDLNSLGFIFKFTL